MYSVTAVPTPVTDLDSDKWFVYEALGNRSITATAVGFDGQASVSKEIDSKAMRKVVDGDQLVGVVETDANSNGVLFRVAMSHLLKLH